MLEIRYDERPGEESGDLYDYIQVFGTVQAELEDLVKQMGEAGKYDCIFWACYPKKSSRMKSDISREKVWKALELIGLRPVTQVALDETWSAMRARPPQAVGK